MAAGRSSTMVMLALGLGLIVALPVATGGLYSAWRANTARALPPEIEEALKHGNVAEIPPEPVAEPPAPELRPVDAVVFPFCEYAVSAAETPDVAPDAPFRVDLLREGEGPIATHLRVDLDRDGKWDEAWTLGSPITRDVSPDDDGKHTERYQWTGATWEPAPAGDPR